ncbi:MAG: bifunctional hydroxymethylpyrimidine kinase/phosphomethylpyrimidine kinase [Spirochaetes bacterium]|nr:bifunctional hydroxymethylpyrimidine kinase/phosphomethylpyrimidine kinase [Spirochaetota bacterium]
MKHVLTIAGSDSCGGAGIQADLKAFSAMGVYGMSVVSALTAQNTVGVKAVSLVDPAFVAAQLDAVFEDIRVDAVKIGMLGSRAIIGAVADFLRTRRPPILVLDPVMISKSGHALLPPDAVRALGEELLPLASVLTPNLPEAGALLGRGVEDEAGALQAARDLLALGPSAVLLKGGHLPGEPADLLVTPRGVTRFPGLRIDTPHTHGTGCSLASALTALLARGVPLESAVEKAKAYVAEGIRHGIALGKGHGPIHHFYGLYGGEESRL